MTVKDRQCLLTFLKRSDGSSYYSGEIDGIHGPQTQRAIRAKTARMALTAILPLKAQTISPKPIKLRWWLL